jgi:ArsR family transcriptional regulator
MEYSGGEAAVERASRIFRALGDGPRLRMLVRLAGREACVSEVAEAEGEEISTISQRLRVLRNEGLVSRRRQGKRIVYGLADQHVVDLIRNALAHASEPGRYLNAIQGDGDVTQDTHR